MELEIIKDFKGSPHGYDVVDYVKGTTVDMPESLAKVAIEEKWAKRPKGQPTDKQQQAAAVKALQDEIAALEKSLGDAAEADKPTLAAQIEGKKQALKELTDE